MGHLVAINQVKNLLVASHLSYNVVSDCTLEVDNINLHESDRRIFMTGIRKLVNMVDVIEGRESLLIRLKQA